MAEIRTAAAASGPPESVNLRPAGSELIVTWEPPSAVHGAAVTEYRLELTCKEDGATKVVAARTVKNTTKASFDQLEPNTEYAVMIQVPRRRLWSQGEEGVGGPREEKCAHILGYGVLV